MLGILSEHPHESRIRQACSARASVICLMCMLGKELWSSGRAGSDLYD